jgi:hypothetical protein
MKIVTWSNEHSTNQHKLGCRALATLSSVAALHAMLGLKAQ